METEAQRAEREEDRIWMDAPMGPPAGPSFLAKCAEAEAKIEGTSVTWRARFEVDPEGRMGLVPIDSGGWWLSGTGRCPFYPGMKYDVRFSPDFVGVPDDPDYGPVLHVYTYYWNPKVLGEKAGYWEAKFRLVWPVNDWVRPEDDLPARRWEMSLLGRGYCPFEQGAVYWVRMAHVGDMQLTT